MVIAGEASGDLHGANLVAAARELDPGLDFFGMGGDRLEKAGLKQVYNLEHSSMMGITEVLSSVGKFWVTFQNLKRMIVNDRPSAVVLIDYPELNLPLAKAAKRSGIPVFYYVCPQIWAWRTWRVRKMGRFVDRRVVVFPFEKDFYESHGLSADFLGHPLLDIIDPPLSKARAKKELGLDPDRPLLLLMPGSRKHLVELLLPVMLQAARLILSHKPRINLALARADTIPHSFIKPFLDKGPDGIEVLSGRSHLLQNAADLAVVASGTSTLETALMLTPMVVIYQTNPLSYRLARKLVKTDHVAIPNLIAGEGVVPELLQDSARPDRIAAEALRILTDVAARRKMISGLEKIRSKLGEPGAASRAAELLLGDLENRPIG